MQPRLIPQTFSFLFIAILVSFTSCKKNNSDGVTYKKISRYQPVLSSKQQVLDKINGNSNEPVVTAGKMFIKDNFIYLNEVQKGIHIIDNANPSSPKQIAFLQIPGNLDVAVRDNILYADMGSNLIALDISNPKKAVIKADINNFFHYRYLDKAYFNPIDSNFVVVDWNIKDTLVEVRVDGNYANDFLTNAATGAPKSTGTAGSMASMVLMKDHLYAITEPHSVGVVDISVPANPLKKESFYAGFDLETIYPFKDKLFLGSSVGMFMYDVSNPDVPVALGRFSHGRACDPVIAEDAYAFVTLRTGNLCGGSSNELHVLDIKDLKLPLLMKTYQLTNPAGLSKDNDKLLICDGSSGVRIFDASDISILPQIGKLDCPEPFDVIASNGHALVSAKSGLYQFDYSNVKNIRQLSFFKTGSTGK